MLSSPRADTGLIALLVCVSGATHVTLAQGNPSGWKTPMTPWGEPDLRGIWPLNHLISTPFQRPEKFGDRRVMTDEEFAAAQKTADARNQRFLSGAIPQADAGEATRLTSLLVDPAPHDGEVVGGVSDEAR